jgi:7-keto-8-aminopelargonate synthetase-like enzyme
MRSNFPNPVTLRRTWANEAMVRHFASTGELPFFQQIDSVDSPRIGIQGQQCVLLGSNSYIGLATHPSAIAASVKATEEFGVGTTGSRLLNGTYSLHVTLEQQIAEWLGREDAVVFTTAMTTRDSIVSTLRTVRVRHRRIGCTRWTRGSPGEVHCDHAGQGSTMRCRRPRP